MPRLMRTEKPKLQENINELESKLQAWLEGRQRPTFRPAEREAQA